MSKTVERKKRSGNIIAGHPVLWEVVIKSHVYYKKFIAQNVSKYLLIHVLLIRLENPRRFNCDTKMFIKVGYLDI